jgi:acetylornithine deacetylase/succinyl-diaminopimelate desuccinylase-like protein
MPADDLRAAVRGLMERAREDLAALVAFPSVFDPTAAPVDACDGAAQWVADAFAGAGIDAIELTRTPDGSLAVHGHSPGPPDAPTVLLYSHYDVQPPLGEDQWLSPVFELAERDGRWYGRGTADCKGNVVMHLAALRALREVHGGFPCAVKVVCEGSEEQGTGGLERFVEADPEVLRADAIVIGDAGNAAVGAPTLTTSLRGMVTVDVRLDALRSAMHSGMFGGAAPDPVAGLVAMLASLADERGDATIDGVDATQTWDGADYPAGQFRTDATVLDGVQLIGSGTPADMVWARPAVTILGIDVPSLAGAVNAVQASAAARVSVRIPPGMRGADVRDALIAHLRARVPWGLRCTLEPGQVADPWSGTLDGPGFAALSAALADAYGRPATTMGQGGSIPLCTTLARVYPQAEMFLIGVEEPTCLIHAPNESVDPSEIEHMALAEALFLQRYAAASR